ncbi:TetR family transcriptional regulator [Actinomycetes bacterium KLBMP 9759]
MSVHSRRPLRGDRRALLDIAAEVLIADPRASLADVAAAAGVGRTTLHKRYPTREALLVAIGHDSMDRIAEAIDGAGIATAADAAAVRRLLAAFIPLGPRLTFLIRHGDDGALLSRVEKLDAPVEDLIRRAQEERTIREGVPVWWVVSTLYSLAYSAWEAVAAGRLAALDAPALAFDTLLSGIGPSS